jgi:hypothetical protein
VRVERAQHAQHADRLFAARVEAFDLVGRQRRAGAQVELLEGLVAHRAEQVAVQLDLGNRAQHRFQREGGRGGGWSC